VLRGQDILLLVALLRSESSPTLQQIAGLLGLDVASVHRSVKRLEEVQLLLSDRVVAEPQAAEFLEHGLRYVFPARFNGESRGVPTAWAAPPLSDRLAPLSGPPPVWPHPGGRTRGIALEPLHPSAPAAAVGDPTLHARFALVDALRMGDARLRRAAKAALFSEP
jgi:hypothetical protein